MAKTSLRQKLLPHAYDFGLSGPLMGHALFCLGFVAAMMGGVLLYCVGQGGCS